MQSFSPYANFVPGLKIAGGTLNVILNPNAQAEHAQEVQSSETLFANQFYLQTLNPCIAQLPTETKTWINNLVQTSAKSKIFGNVL